jgi:hypothetical protein
MMPSPMEKDYWRTRTIAEADDHGYSHLRVTCSGCGRISDLPWPLLLRRPGITRDSFLGNLKRRCDKCERNDPVIGVNTRANTQGYGRSCRSPHQEGSGFIAPVHCSNCGVCCSSAFIAYLQEDA